MSSLKMLILGASGLTGSFVLKYALEDPRISEVFIWVRKPLGISHPKLKESVVNFLDFETYEANFPIVDSVCCCIGTTLKKAGSKKAFYKTDVTIPKIIAEIAHSKGVKTFILQSSIGANPSSNNFYLKCKGDIENSISALNFSSFVILQPSLLLGNRKENRLTEKSAMYLMRLFSWMFLGPIKKYKAISAEHVAKAMLFAAINPLSRKQTFTFLEIESKAKKY
jgi:uncharacterized protein YbjT (DUF2867 family)